ncbi:hypothetical protein MKX07_005210 [Trichoderma sp. CBMAI-0711]|nr:hypothetical protein MKX07_005210 [Trichoderma sp. CBMAI-0711]
MDRESSPRKPALKRNSTACEHCRAAKAKCQPNAEPSPECLGQSSTFSINYFTPPRPNVDDNFATLREVHNCAFDNLLEINSNSDILQTPSASICSTSSSQPRSLFDTWRKPQFNLASAEALLTSFDCMADYIPFITLPAGSTLAHCIRMAADIIHELGLDENFLASNLWGQGVTEEELDKIRAYLAYVYLVSTYVVVWKGERCVPTRLPAWANIAIDTLEQNAQTENDRMLVALVRLSILCSDASDAMNERIKDTVRNSQLILVGLEQRYQQIRSNILATCPGAFDRETIRMQALFLDIFFDAGSLLAFPVAGTPSPSLKSERIPPPIPKIYSATKKIRVFLDYVGNLDDNALLSFTVNDWTRLIVVLTLAFRLSFPLSLCPDFDWTWASSQIQLEQFLSKVSRDADTVVASNGILSANRVVFGLLKTKFNRRLSSVGDEPTIPSSRTFGCPMMSGGSSLADAQWSSEFAPSEPSTDSDMSDMVFHDMWTAVATGWQDVGDVPWETFDEQLNSVGTCPASGWSI